jgi:L,D-transpeptidase-like protein/putative peptidoglycan binding protein
VRPRNGLPALVLVALGAAAAPAHGQGTPAPGAPPPAPPPAPVPAPPPPGELTITLRSAGSSAGRPLALRGDAVRVRGLMTPYVAGERVVVRAYRGKRKLLARRVALRPTGGGAAGRFTLTFRARRSGTVVVRAGHLATPQLGRLAARPARVRVLRDRAGLGARGPVVRLLQARLAGLGYAVPRSGRFDDGTARAVVAYRKVTGLARVPVADARVLHWLLRGRGHFRVRFPGHGRHVEADLSRQVLALVDGRRVYRIYPASSGAPGTPTVLGTFRFYSKTPGVNAKGMLDSNYFIGGYAVHGYPSVPIYNASHGCLRVPIPNAAAIFRWVRIGDRIDVYP